MYLLYEKDVFFYFGPFPTTSKKYRKMAANRPSSNGYNQGMPRPNSIKLGTIILQSLENHVVVERNRNFSENPR